MNAPSKPASSLPLTYTLPCGYKIWRSGWYGPQAVYFGSKGMKVLVSRDATPHGDLLHLSVSFPARDPSWRLLRELKEVFFGIDVDAMQILPRVEHYVNNHPHCFHLWEIPGGWGFTETV